MQFSDEKLFSIVLHCVAAISTSLCVVAHVKSNSSRLCLLRNSSRATPMIATLTLYLSSAMMFAVFSFGKLIYCEMKGESGVTERIRRMSVFAVLALETMFSVTRYLDIRFAKRHVRQQTCLEVLMVFLIVSVVYLVMAAVIFFINKVFMLALASLHLLLILYLSLKFVACVRGTYSHTLLEMHFPEQFQLAQQEFVTIFVNMCLTVFAGTCSACMLIVGFFRPTNEFSIAVWIGCVSVIHTMCLSSNRNFFSQILCCCGWDAKTCFMGCQQAVVACLVADLQTKERAQSTSTTLPIPRSSALRVDTPQTMTTPISPLPIISLKHPLTPPVVPSPPRLTEKRNARPKPRSAPNTPTKSKKYPFSGEISWKDYQRYLEEYSVAGRKSSLKVDEFTNSPTFDLRGVLDAVGNGSWSAGSSPRSGFRTFHLDFSKLEEKVEETLQTPLVTPGKVDDELSRRSSASQSSLGPFPIFPPISGNDRRTDEESLATYIAEEGSALTPHTTPGSRATRSVNAVDQVRVVMVVQPIVDRQRSEPIAQVQNRNADLDRQTSLQTTLSLSDLSGALRSVERQRALRDTLDMSRTLNAAGLTEVSVFGDFRNLLDDLTPIDEDVGIDIV